MQGSVVLLLVCVVVGAHYYDKGNVYIYLCLIVLSDNYLHHWVDATPSGRFVPEGIISPVVDTSVLT